MRVIFVLSVLGCAVAAIAAHSADSEDDPRKSMHPDFTADDAAANSGHARPVSRALPGEKTAQFWRTHAQRHLVDRLAQQPNENRARNVILFLGDGMSLATVAATRVYMGGEELSLSFEEFPYFGLSKTYCVNRQVADSACTATAYLSGVKGNYGTVGINARVQRYDCEGGDRQRNAQTVSIAGWAQQNCKATGLVTTSRVTHASPAGVFANTANRDWETDANIREQCGERAGNTVDIARQLIEGEIGSGLKVILGGGRQMFRNVSAVDEEGRPGKRTDGRDLIEEWQQRQVKANRRAEYVWNKEQLGALKADTESVMGLFEDNHCRFNSELTASAELRNSEPTLSDMTEAAIRVLDKQPEGYFLFVESARIDMAHHENWARRALDETAEFHKTVEMARRMTNESDTLIVVTSDHAHVMTYNGYPLRGNDILGLSGRLGTDNLPYPTLSYANGPGYVNTYKDGARADVSGLDFSDPELMYMATVPRDSETHGGDDVGVYASGPWSHLFVGTYEQSNLPVVMAFAAKIGMYADSSDQCSGAAQATASVGLAGAVLLAAAAMRWAL